MSKISNETWEWRIRTAYAWVCKVARQPVDSDRPEIQGLRGCVKQILGLSSEGQIDYVIDVLKHMGLVEHKLGARHYVTPNRTFTQDEIMASVASVQAAQAKRHSR